MGHRKPMVVAIAAASLGMTLSGIASAAGYALNEQSSHASGTANAGSAANVENASILYFNPAGMTRLKGTQLSFGAAVLDVDPKADIRSATDALGRQVPGSDGGDFIDLAVIPNFYLTHTMDNFSAGIGVYVPFGLTSDYENDFRGRYLADETEIQVISISPSFAFNLNEQLSLGFSLNVMYGEGKLTRYQDYTSGLLPAIAAGQLSAAQAQAIAADYFDTNPGYFDVEGDDWELGWTAGLLYSPTDSTHFGLTYRSEADLNLEGDLSLTNYPNGAAVVGAALTGQPPSADLYQSFSGGGEVPLTTPESVTFSVKQDFGDQWSLLLGTTWTRWSRFQNLDIFATDAGSMPIAMIGSTKYQAPLDSGLVGHVEENFKNTWSAAIGVLFHLNPNWTLKAGYAFDESAVEDTYLTARVPSSDRQWLTLGAQWKEPSSGWTVDAAFGYLIIDDVEVNEFERSVNDQILPGGTNYQAKYEIDAWGAGLQISKGF